jgi:NADPH:quinone reductase
VRALVMTGPSTGPELTEVVELEPPAPGPGEVAIDVAYAGLNFVDVMARRGDAGYVSGWPYRPGFEVAGTVRALGEGVGHLFVGQQVAAMTGSGGFAEVATVSADLAVPVPTGVSLPVAAGSAVVMATAILLLTDVARFRPGDRVLVHSASGGVGTALAQVAAALGGGVLIGTVGRADKVEAARKSGYDIALVRGEDLAESIKQATGGVDVIFDALGTSQLDTDLSVLAPHGRVVLFGNAGGDAVGALPPPGRLIGGNATIGGFSISALSRVAPQSVGAAIARGLSMVAAGAGALEVTEIDSLDDVPAYHQLLAEGRGVGKYVVRVAR